MQYKRLGNGRQNKQPGVNNFRLPFPSCGDNGINTTGNYGNIRLVRYVEWSVRQVILTHYRGLSQLSPLYVAKHLSIAQDFAKVYVEHVTRPLDHDVVVVPVTDAQDVGGHTVTSTGVCEVLHCLQSVQ